MATRYKGKSRYRSLLGSAVSALILFAHITAGAETVDKIAAEVNGEIILRSEIRERMFQMRAADALPRELDEKGAEKKVLEELINQKLIIQYGKEKEIKVPSIELDKAIKSFQERLKVSTKELEILLDREGMTMERYRQMLEEQILAQKVIAQEVRSQVQLTESDIADYYNEHKSEFTTSQKIAVRHIVLILKEDAPKEEAEEVLHRVEKVREEIIAGLDFAEAARKYSEGPSLENGGYLGEISKGEMVPAFEEAAFALEPGKLSEPVRTPYGYHLIKVESSQGGETLVMEKVRTEIENRIYAKLVTEIQSEWLEQLKRDAFIDIK